MGVADFEEALKKTLEYHLRLQLGKNCKKGRRIAYRIKEAILESDKTIEQERLL